MTNCIEIKGLCKSYPDFSLQNIDLTLPGGTIMGLIGENGAGKTTTIKCILNLIRRDAGEITLLGRDNLREERAAKAGVGVVLDECVFHGTWSASWPPSIPPGTMGCTGTIWTNSACPGKTSSRPSPGE